MFIEQWLLLTLIFIAITLSLIYMSKLLSTYSKYVGTFSQAALHPHDSTVLWLRGEEFLKQKLLNEIVTVENKIAQLVTAGKKALLSTWVEDLDPNSLLDDSGLMIMQNRKFFIASSIYLTCYCYTFFSVLFTVFFTLLFAITVLKSETFYCSFVYHRNLF